VGFVVATFKKFGEDQAGSLAALVSYYGFFSLFPLMLVFVTVTGFVLGGHPDLQDKLLTSALADFPVIGDQIRQNVGSLGGNGLALIVGIVGALWAGLGAVQAVQNAMNSVWHVPHRERPNFLMSRLRALLVLAVAGVAVIGSVVLTGLGAAASSVPLFGKLALVPVILAFDIALFLAAFKVLTDNDVGIRGHLPGAIVAGVVWYVLQVVGSLYVNHVVKGASATYGFFAIVIGLLSWMYLQAQLLLLAAEINTVSHDHLWPRGLRSDDLTDADRRSLESLAKVEERIPPEQVAVDLPSDQEEEART